MKKSFAKGVSYMLLSATCFSLGYLFVKLGTFDYPFFWLVFVRYCIGFICLSAVLIWQKRFFKSFKTNHFTYHFLRTLAVTGSQYSLFYYLSQSTLLNATVLMNTAPFFIPLIDRIFLGYRIAKATLIGLLISGIGIVLILNPGRDLFQWMTLYGLLAGFLWAISQTIYGYNVREEKEQASLFYIFFLGTLMAIPALFIFPISFSNLPKEAFHFTGIFILVGLGIFTLLNQFFRGKAYTHGKPTRLAVLLYLSIVFSGVFDWAFFQIVPNLLTIVGSILVILGAIINSMHVVD